MGDKTLIDDTVYKRMSPIGMYVHTYSMNYSVYENVCMHCTYLEWTHDM